MFSSLPTIRPVTKLTPLVTRILGHNPGPHTLQGTNSYLVGAPNLSRILIDTTNKGKGLQTYLDYLKPELERCTTATPLSALILTHWHPDHTEGVNEVLDLAYEISKRNTGRIEPIPVYKYPGGPDLDRLNFYKGTLTSLFEDQRIPVPVTDGDLEAIYLRVCPSPGHAVDHVCFVLERNERAVCLFTGDMILGHGSTTVQNLPSFMNSLYATRALVEQELGKSNEPLLLLSSHGVESTDALGKVDEYITNRRSRISKTIEFLLSHPPDVWCSESDILQFVYPGIPESLQLDALWNLRHSLFWIASGREPNDPPFNLYASLSLGSTRRAITYDHFVELLTGAEKHLLTAQSSAVADDVRTVLCSSWEWKRSVT